MEHPLRELGDSGSKKSCWRYRRANGLAVTEDERLVAASRRLRLLACRLDQFGDMPLALLAYAEAATSSEHQLLGDISFDAIRGVTYPQTLSLKELVRFSGGEDTIAAVVLLKEAGNQYLIHSRELPEAVHIIGEALRKQALFTGLGSARAE